jgi:peptidoglycan/LPS O-acetylase OafA/YrhL
MANRSSTELSPPATPTKASTLSGSAGADAAFDTFRATKVFRSLDGLRAFSIIAVIGFHAVHPPGLLFSHGNLGVELFFAISGVLITSLLLRERDTSGQISLYNFYVRRSLRIFPLYYAVLMAYVALTYLMERDTDRGQTFFSNLPAFLTYTSNWFVTLSTTTTTIFFFAWSLATEEQFYLFWPSIVRYSRKRFLPVVAILLVMLAGEVVRYVVRAGWTDGRAIPLRMIQSTASAICLGCVAAYALHHRRSFRVLYAIAGRVWSVPAAVLLLVGTVSFAPAGLAISLTMVFLVVACIIRERHCLSWMLDNRPIRHIGMISYGMYLMHMLTYNFVRKIVPPAAGRWATFLVTLAAVIAVASLSFRFFERKVQGLKKHLERRTGAQA